MDPHHREVIANDEREVKSLAHRFVVRAKLVWYGLSRPALHRKLKRALLDAEPRLAKDPVFLRVTRFLNGEGGMFKEYVYERCSQSVPLKDARVLVPGVGYAKNILQLAAFRPKEIIAFDLFDYPEVWAMMTQKLRDDFDVPITFYKGDFSALPPELKGSFDFVISDAVLEHVPDMPAFANGSYEFLKPGGIFYASFGPLWYGPSGDHTVWGAERLFDHLLLSKEEYSKQVSNRSLAIVDKDSCDPGFMIQEDFFSYLKGSQYLADMDKAGFRLLHLENKTSPESLVLLRARPDIRAALDAKDLPIFDRYSGGMYLWACKP